MMKNKELYFEKRKEASLVILSMVRQNRLQTDIDLKYATLLGENIDNQLAAWIENGRLKEELALMKQGENQTQIMQKVEEKFAPFDKKLEDAKRKREFSITYFENKKYDEEILAQLDEKFLIVANNLYPSLKVTDPTNDDLALWRAAHFFYLNDKLQDLTKVADSSHEPDVSGLLEESFVKFNAVIDKLIGDINKNMEEALNTYPLNQKSVIEDEMEIIRVEAKYRQTTYDLIRETASLKEQISQFKEN